MRLLLGLVRSSAVSIGIKQAALRVLRRTLPALTSEEGGAQQQSALSGQRITAMVQMLWDWSADCALFRVIGIVPEPQHLEVGVRACVDGGSGQRGWSWRRMQSPRM